MKNKKLGIVADNRFFDHKISTKTRENPERLRNIYRKLNDVRFSSEIELYAPRVISDTELMEIHSQPYVDQIRNYCLADNPYSYDKDTYLMQDSFYTAKLAAGGGLVLADAIMGQQIQRGYSLVRPPGHHAGVGFGMGFCIFNNIAIVANYLLKKHHLNRILILDFDVHHGNGTQDVFYNSDQVLVVSIHQNSIFPFTGEVKEFGSSNGRGYNVNIPVYPQYGDQEYTYIFGKIIHQIIEQFLPQFILVSAGYDGHRDDSISEIKLSTNWYADITKMIKYFAKEHCEDRLLYLLEGGYNISSLEESVLATLKELIKDDACRPAVPFSQKAEKLFKEKLDPIYREKWLIQ